MDNRKLSYTLKIAIVLITGIILLIAFAHYIKVLEISPTSRVIQSFEDINKNCFFKVGEKTISMYNCHYKEDCTKKIKDLKKQISNDIHFNIIDNDIEVIDCVETK